MAEEKKPAPTNNKEHEDEDMFVEIVSAIIILMILAYALNGFVSAISSSRIFSGGWQGITPRGVLISHTKPISSLENPIGARVVSINDTEVYDSPGGNKVGEHKWGARGKILQGPVEIDGERYWYVDYDEGPDGWVRESDIAHLEREPNLLASMFISIFSLYWYIRILVFFVSIILIVCIVYLFKKLSALRENEYKLLYPQSKAIESAVNPHWERVLNYLESVNDNDWRLAILEADIILGDLLDRLHLEGDTIGDKLKSVEKSDFTTIDNAWEAHKVRNQVAHEGSSFILTQRKAREVVSLYQSVFEEFHIV